MLKLGGAEPSGQLWDESGRSKYAALSFLLGPRSLIDHAEAVTGRILDTYLESDNGFVELHNMAKDGTIDLLRELGTCLPAGV
ncbi:hypothetical protein [Bradyrhizobium sp. USDA 4502]